MAWPGKRALRPLASALRAPKLAGARCNAVRILGLVPLLLGLIASAVVHALLELAVWAMLVPVALCLGLTLYAVDLAVLLAGRETRRRPRAAIAPAARQGHRDRGSASVVIPSWNGRELLARLLPTLRQELQRHGGDHEVIVVDNGSDDGSAAWLAAQHPWVRVVRLEQNRFFGGGVMAGAAQATRDVLVLLNNDMVVEPGFLAPLLEGLAAPDVFAATAQIEFAGADRRREESGKTRGSWRRGALVLRHAPTSPADARVDGAPVLWAGGGSTAYDRGQFVALGGLDPLYDPFYLEDLDLSYRAWKGGLRVVFTARSRVRHEHRATVRRFPPAVVERVLVRNQYQFAWSNLGDPLLTLSHCFWLPGNAVASARRRRGTDPVPLLRELTGLASALARIGAIARRRFAAQRRKRRSDREVLAIANRDHRPAPRLAAGSSEALRLLVLAARLPRLDTDGSWVLFNLLRELARRHEVTLFAFLDRREEAAQAEPLRAFCRAVHLHVRSAGGDVANLHQLVPHRLARDYSAPHMRAAVREVLATTDFDLVQVEYVEMAHLVHRELADIPSVCTVHEPLSVFCERLFAGARGAARAWKLMKWAQALEYELRLLPRFGRIITLSSADERELRGYLPDLAVTSVPSGVDVERFRPTPEVEPQALVAFVGYFKHVPNVDGALWLAREVFPRVRAQLPTARLCLVGRDPPDAVRAAAESPGVEVAGFVADLEGLMARAAVMAVPIRLGGGLRGKVLEAWSAGKAVVTTSRGGDGLALAPGRNALVADDAPGFAQALVDCLRDAGLRQRLGNEARRTVLAEFTAAAAARRYEQIYREVLSGV